LVEIACGYCHAGKKYFNQFFSWLTYCEALTQGATDVVISQKYDKQKTLNSILIAIKQLTVI
jgi:hypothetical protein